MICVAVVGEAGLMDEYQDIVKLQRELVDLTKEMKSMMKRKHVILRTLKKAGTKPIRPDYYDKPIYLYVLRLKHECWYIGMTRNVEKRYKMHLKGKGAMWTKLHEPIELFSVVDTKTNDDSEAGLMEDQFTIEFAKDYGVDFVRGGGYCQTKPQWPTEVYEESMIYRFD